MIFKQKLSEQAIVPIIFFVPIIGILSEFCDVKNGKIIGFISALASSLSLSWIDIDHTFYFDINVFDLLFYALLLLGAVLYITSQKRKSRLIRFVFSVIFFNRLLFVIYALYSIILNGFNQYGYVANSPVKVIIYFLVRLGWCWLAIQVVLYLNEKHKLAVTSFTDYDGSVLTSYVNTAKSWRLANFLIDIVTRVLVFSLVIELYAKTQSNILVKLQYVVGDRLTFYLLIIFCSTLYYLSFERLLGITPAKLLTGTRVIDEQGNQPQIKRLLIRTFARFIPFDTLSFVFNEMGWHDKLSNTYVVDEESNN